MSSGFLSILRVDADIPVSHMQSYISAEGAGIQKASGNIKQLLPVFTLTLEPGVLTC